MLKNIIINNLSLGLQFGSRWVLNIVLLKNLSISEFGLFSFLYSVSNILSSTLPFGSSIYIFKENTQDGNKNLVINSFIVVLISFCIVVFLYLCLLLFNIKINGSDYMLYPIILGLLTSLNMILASYLKSMSLFIKELKVYFLFSILLFGTIFYIYIKQTIDISRVFQMLILINFITILFFIKISSIKLRVLGFNQSLTNIKGLFNDRLYYGLQEIQTAIYGQSSVIILFYLLTTELYGTYRALIILIMPISLISYSMSQVFINYLKKDIENINSRFRKIFLFSFFSALAIFSLYFIFQVQLLDLINLDTKNKDLLILLTILVFLKLTNSSYCALLIVLNKQKLRFYGALLSSVVFISLILSLIEDTDIKTAILINLFATFVLSIVYTVFGEINL
ncbi:MAG TPA: hypothetical protein EYG73_08620, partial [Arcobacter sp.]|nr:hypothetical protein [Arcobacter sp.]